MAEHHPTTPAVVDNDYVEHEKTYDLFVAMMKWGTIASILLLMITGSMTGTLPWWLTILTAIGLFAASNLV